ncbi:MAG: glycosyltransferase [Candidatus Levyibacteriota bacterium]
MKIAFVHDYIKEYGGAERVLETLHDMYPDAPVFTLVYCPEFLGPHEDRFKTWDIRPSVLQYIPYKEKLISIFRLIAPFVFSSFDFSGYDVVVVSATGAYCPNMIRKGKAKHICYCHTPPRYLYGYETARDWKKNLFVRACAELANHILRMVDFISSQQVDLFIANSQNVQKRIEKFYRKDAVVVYPPVAVPFVDTTGKRTYFLAGGRLARPKHIDLIIHACNKLQIPLKIFGKGFAGYGEELRSIAGKTVEFVGEVSDEEKIRLMAGAKAFIFAGVDEDFGIVPVEAMGVGTPVIAYKSGGVLETVIDGKTGVFFDELTVESLVAAIKKVEKTKISSETCKRQAEKFSKEKFFRAMSKVIQN